MDKTGKLVFVDLFAGCGGLSLGLELAGFRPLLFCELSDSAAATYLVNRPQLVKSQRVKNVRDLTANNCAELRRIKKTWENEGVKLDLVCGGPPCQGYSGIGHRRTFKLDKNEIPSNHLYKEMVQIIRVLRPRLFLFENVRGITFGRWTESGEPHEIWLDVQREFQTLRDDGYFVPDGNIVHGSDFGVPQNRPRALIVGTREPWVAAPKKLAHGLLPEGGDLAPNIKDVLGDLLDGSYEPGTKESAHYAPKRPSDIQKWFRMPAPKGLGVPVPPGVITEQQYTTHSERVVTKFAHMISSDGKIPSGFETKKFAQRVLPAEWKTKGKPTITVTSLPDDFVHFSQPRILTVREWARLQTFPDWYQFKGPRTTGGHRRAGVPTKGIWDREVPRYTQIGNAVPVKLALALGKHFRKILCGGTRVAKAAKATHA